MYNPYGLLSNYPLGFPDTFHFPVKDGPAYKQLGNSVAVPVMKAVADEMAKHL